LLPWSDGLLLDRYDISQLPSLSLLTLPSTRAAPRSRPRARVLVAEAGPPLHFAATESKAVRLGGARGVTQRATRADFNAALTDPDVDLVHVIAHGFAATPNRSAELGLTPTKDDDGRIRAEDILLDAEAVAPRWMVFSTCEVGTSRGGLVDDGFLVGNALLLHGLDEAVVPLWQVEDSKHTVEFWREFYRALRRHDSLAKALNEAQREARARGLPISVWGAYKVLSRTP
jgi:CHAT domain-containing protein